MKKIFKSMALAMGALLMLAGCGENDVYPGGSGGSGNEGGGGSASVPANMVDYEMSGIVTDTDGHAIEGVSVVSGKESTTTLSSGFFTLDRSNEQYGHCVVRFEKAGYFPVTKSFDMAGDSHACKVVMASKGSSSSTTSVSFNSAQGRTVNVGGLTIGFPAGGFKRVSDGSRYSGTVNVDVLHLSPDNAGFYEMMPGDLTALDAESQYKALISYGMANVVMTDEGGSSLQLAEGSEATIRFKVPASMKDAPAEIPLWSFHEGYGVWKEEQMATRQPDGSYLGKASHFSWVNLDWPEEIATVQGQVRNTQGQPVSNVRVTINNFIHVYTDADGYFAKSVPSGVSFPVTVLSEDYGDYAPVVTENVEPLEGGETRHVEIVLPLRYKVYGRIEDSYGIPVRTIYDMELKQGDLGQKTFDLVNGKDGKYEYYLPWDFSGEGKITAYSRNGKAVEKEFTVPEGTDVEVNVTIGTGGSTGGPDITAECPGEDTHVLRVVRPGNTTFGGVMIEDDRLMVMTEYDDEDYSDEGNQFMVYVDGYSPEKTEYDNAIVQAQDGRKSVYSPSGRLTVTRSGDSYYFTFEGSGYYSDDVNGEDDWKEGIIRVHNVDIMHLLTAETRTRYTPAAPIPSFCPRLSVPAPVASVITESKKLGTGGMLYYNGGKSDFVSLCNQASRSGLTQVMYELDDAAGEGEAAYQGTRKALMIDYYADAEEIDADRAVRNGLFVPSADTEEDYEIEAQLSVMALQGGTMSFLELMAGDDAYSAAAASTPSLIRRNAKSARALARKAMKRR